MEKSVYLIASDLHFSYKNLRSRKNYRDEMTDVKMQMIRTAADYKKQGYSVKLILLGDVFHNSYNDVFNACVDNNFFFLWNEAFGEIYSVLGNHELTYYSCNPFYTLVSCINSVKISNILNNVWTPLGAANIIQIVDKLEAGNVAFHFNHYGTPYDRDFPKEDKIHVGLFHQNLVSGEIVTCMEQQLGKQLYEKTVDIEGFKMLNEYDYCFFGHMHSIYGTFRTDYGTTLCYLASLGRTNVTEVNDNFLHRKLPGIVIHDSKFVRIDDNEFMLKSREESVNDKNVKAVADDYKVQVERKKLKDIRLTRENPVDDVRMALGVHPGAYDVFESLLKNSQDEITMTLHSKVRNLHKNFII